VIALNGNNNICSLTFNEQFAAYGITGISSKLVIDDEEGTAMVHIDCSTRVIISRGAIPQGRDDPAWDRRNEMVAADTITRVDMILFEKHLGRRWLMCRMNFGGPPGSF
jgi:hypothetical protein